MDAGPTRDSPAAAWHACYTRSNHEKQVAARLQDRGFETYLPVVTRSSRRKDRSQTLAVPLFPGYVFCRFSLADIYEVLRVPGLCTVVRSADGRWVAIRSDELQNIRRLVAGLGATDDEPVVTSWASTGRRIVFASGDLEGVHGVVVRVRSRDRVLVGIASIDQALLLNVDTRLLRPDDTA